MLIPGAGKRMAHEFEEYRPWKAWAQFDKEIGKYVNAQEVARLAQVRFHSDGSEHRERRRSADDPRSRSAHAPRAEGVPAVEIAGPLRQGDRQVRRPEGSGPAGPLPDVAVTAFCSCNPIVSRIDTPGRPFSPQALTNRQRMRYIRAIHMARRDWSGGSVSRRQFIRRAAAGAGAVAGTTSVAQAEQVMRQQGGPTPSATRRHPPCRSRRFRLSRSSRYQDSG